MTNRADYFFRECLEKQGSSSISLLFIGDGCYENLLSLYEKALVMGYNTIWVEKPNSRHSFWKKILSGARPVSVEFYENMAGIEEMFERGEIDGHNALKLVLDASEERQHLFIPNIDEIFYKFDVPEKKGLREINKDLRSAWHEKSGKLNIYASAKDIESPEWKATLGNYDFMFYAGNFHVVNCD